MSYCTKCGKINPDSAKFCSFCGNLIIEQIVITEKKVNTNRWLILSIVCIAALAGIFYILFYKKNNSASNEILPASKTNVDELIGTWKNVKSGEHTFIYKQDGVIFWVEEGGIAGGYILDLKIRDDCFYTTMAKDGNKRYIELSNKILNTNIISSALSGCGCCIKYNSKNDIIVIKDNDINNTDSLKRINRENKNFDLDEIIIKKIKK